MSYNNDIIHTQDTYSYDDISGDCNELSSVENGDDSFASVRHTQETHRSRNHISMNVCDCDSDDVSANQICNGDRHDGINMTDATRTCGETLSYISSDCVPDSTETGGAGGGGDGLSIPEDEESSDILNRSRIEWGDDDGVTDEALQPNEATAHHDDDDDDGGLCFMSRDVDDNDELFTMMTSLHDHIHDGGVDDDDDDVELHYMAQEFNEDIWSLDTCSIHSFSTDVDQDHHTGRHCSVASPSSDEGSITLSDTEPSSPLSPLSRGGDDDDVDDDGEDDAVDLTPLVVSNREEFSRDTLILTQRDVVQLYDFYRALHKHVMGVREKYNRRRYCDNACNRRCDLDNQYNRRCDPDDQYNRRYDPDCEYNRRSILDEQVRHASPCNLNNSKKENRNDNNCDNRDIRNGDTKSGGSDNDPKVHGGKGEQCRGERSRNKPDEGNDEEKQMLERRVEKDESSIMAEGGIQKQEDTRRQQLCGSDTRIHSTDEIHSTHQHKHQQLLSVCDTHHHHQQHHHHHHTRLLSPDSIDLGSLLDSCYSLYIELQYIAGVQDAEDYILQWAGTDEDTPPSAQDTGEDTRCDEDTTMDTRHKPDTQHITTAGSRHDEIRQMKCDLRALQDKIVTLQDTITSLERSTEDDAHDHHHHQQPHHSTGRLQSYDSGMIDCCSDVTSVSGSVALAVGGSDDVTDTSSSGDSRRMSELCVQVKQCMVDVTRIKHMLAVVYRQTRIGSGDGIADVELLQNNGDGDGQEVKHRGTDDSSASTTCSAITRLNKVEESLADTTLLCKQNAKHLKHIMAMLDKREDEDNLKQSVEAHNEDCSKKQALSGNGALVLKKSGSEDVSEASEKKTKKVPEIKQALLPSKPGMSNIIRVVTNSKRKPPVVGGGMMSASSSASSLSTATLSSVSDKTSDYAAGSDKKQRDNDKGDDSKNIRTSPTEESYAEVTAKYLPPYRAAPPSAHQYGRSSPHPRGRYQRYEERQTQQIHTRYFSGSGRRGRGGGSRRGGGGSGGRVYQYGRSNRDGGADRWYDNNGFGKYRDEQFGKQQRAGTPVRRYDDRSRGWTPESDGWKHKSIAITSKGGVNSICERDDAPVRQGSVVKESATSCRKQAILDPKYGSSSSKDVEKQRATTKSGDGAKHTVTSTTSTNESRGSVSGRHGSSARNSSSSRSDKNKPDDPSRESTPVYWAARLSSEERSDSVEKNTTTGKKKNNACDQNKKSSSGSSDGNQLQENTQTNNVNGEISNNRASSNNNVSSNNNSNNNKSYYSAAAIAAGAGKRSKSKSRQRRRRSSVERRSSVPSVNATSSSRANDD